MLPNELGLKPARSQSHENISICSLSKKYLITKLVLRDMAALFCFSSFIAGVVSDLLSDLRNNLVFNKVVDQRCQHQDGWLLCHENIFSYLKWSDNNYFTGLVIKLNNIMYKNHQWHCNFQKIVSRSNPYTFFIHLYNKGYGAPTLFKLSVPINFKKQSNLTF